MNILRRLFHVCSKSVFSVNMQSPDYLFGAIFIWNAKDLHLSDITTLLFRYPICLCPKQPCKPTVSFHNKCSTSLTRSDIEIAQSLNAKINQESGLLFSAIHHTPRSYWCVTIIGSILRIINWTFSESTVHLHYSAWQCVELLQIILSVIQEEARNSE